MWIILFQIQCFCSIYLKNTYKDKEIDNLFWYTPYKLFAHISPPLKLPELCVYDLSQKQLSCMDYDSTRMISAEI